MIREKETEPLHYRVSRLEELPRPVDRENYLEERVRQARKLGVSYGVYMAMLYEGRIEDPLRGGEINGTNKKRRSRAGEWKAAD